MKKSILIKLSFALFVYAGLSPGLLNLKRIGLVNKNPDNSLIKQVDHLESSIEQSEHDPLVQHIDFKTSTNLHWRDVITSAIHQFNINLDTSVHPSEKDSAGSTKKSNLQKKHAPNLVMDNADYNLPLESSLYLPEKGPDGQDGYYFYYEPCAAANMKPTWKLAFLLPMIFAYYQFLSIFSVTCSSTTITTLSVF